MPRDFEQAMCALAEAGRRLYALDLVPATSGNFSMRLDHDHIVITVSGCQKGRLTADDTMLINVAGHSLDGRRPSAETGLHVQIYQRLKGAGAVLHPHSVHATLLSKLQPGPVTLADYELLKAFKGITTHATRLLVPIFDNDQDIERLATTVDQWMAARIHKQEPVHGYLIRGHGFYTWGDTIEDALRHAEAFDFLFKCELMLRGVAVQ